MKTIEEVRDYLIKNRTNGLGTLDLIGLDLSEFRGAVNLSNMRVRGNLYLDDTEVGENIFMSGCVVDRCMYSNDHKVDEHLYQQNSSAQRLREGGHEVVEDYTCEQSKVGGKSNMKRSIKLLEKITMKELNELGYELVGDNWYDL